MFRGIAVDNAQSPYTGNTFAKTVAATAVGAFVGYKAIRNLNIKNIPTNTNQTCLKITLKIIR